MESIKFSTNWNNKLGNRIFTSIRPNSNKYETNKIYGILLQTNKMGIIHVNSQDKKIDYTPYVICGKYKLIQKEIITWGMLKTETAAIKRLLWMDSGYDQKSIINVFYNMYKSGIDEKGDSYEFVILTLQNTDVPFLDTGIEEFMKDENFRVVPKNTQIEVLDFLIKLIGFNYGK